MFVRGSALALLLGSLTPTALAQTGFLDQVAPVSGSAMSGGPQIFVQQEVRAGIPGQLEGFEFTAQAGIGAQYRAAVRMGTACNTSPLSFSTVVTTTGPGPQQTVFVDCTSANIQLVTGTLFVIELAMLTPLQGSLVGSGEPFYPHALVTVVGVDCFKSSLLRLAFKTYVLGPPSQPTYCTAKLNSKNCLPSIATFGTPSATATEGFTIRAVLVRNQTPGILLYTNAGRAALPFQGGTLCLASPIHRSAPLSSAGAPPPYNNCTGIFALDMNAFAHGLLGGSPAPYLTTSGTVVDAQFWGRDSGFAPPNDTTLTNALEYTVP